MPVDLLTHVDDRFLEKHQITKQICTVISKSKQAELIELFDYNIVPGGSAANQAATLALLDNDINFIAPYGTDLYGNIALKSLEELGINVTDPTPDCDTQIIFILLTSDGARSFAAHYDRDILPDLSLLQQSEAHYLSINGFAFHHTAYANGILSLCKKDSFSGQELIFCPNDVSVINDCNAMCHEYYKACSHIIMNDVEAKTLLSIGSHDALIETLQKDKKSGALTYGENGAYVFTPDNVLHVPSCFDPKNLVDSNGAGDAFSAGYIHGLLNGFSLEKTGQIASVCAASILGVTGARAPHDLASLIKNL